MWPQTPRYQRLQSVSFTLRPLFLGARPSSHGCHLCARAQSRAQKTDEGAWYAGPSVCIGHCSRPAWAPLRFRLRPGLRLGLWHQFGLWLWRRDACWAITVAGDLPVVHSNVRDCKRRPLRAMLLSHSSVCGGPSYATSFVQRDVGPGGCLRAAPLKCICCRFISTELN